MRKVRLGFPLCRFWRRACHIRHHDRRRCRRGSGLGRRGKVSTSLLGPRGALDPVDPDRYTLAPARPEESVDRIAVSSQGFAWNGCSASRGLSRFVDPRQLPCSHPNMLGGTCIRAQDCMGGERVRPYHSAARSGEELKRPLRFTSVDLRVCLLNRDELQYYQGNTQARETGKCSRRRIHCSSFLRNHYEMSLCFRFKPGRILQLP